MTIQSHKTPEDQLADAQRTIARLRSEKHNYRSLLQFGVNGILVCSAEDQFVYANDRLCELSGYRRQEIVGRHLQGLLVSETPIPLPPIDSDGDSPPVRPEMRPSVLKHKNGEQLSVMLGIGQTEWNGEPAKLLLVSDNSPMISQLESEAVLAAMIETTDDLIVALDNEKRVLVANGAFRKLFYRLYEQDLNSRESILTHLPDERKKFWRDVISETQTMGCQRFDQQYFVQKYRYDIEWSTSRIRSKAGDTIGVALFGRDLTHRRRAEETLRERDTQLHHAQKLEAVGTLAGGVAHEFNNAMSIVLGNLEMASMDIYAEHPVRPYIEDAKAGILRAKKVVRQLLDFSRKSDGERQKVQLHPITSNALSLLRASIPSHIEFHQLINPCPPVMADPAHIHQLLINLCTNGAEAMDEDGGVLTVTLDPIQLKPGKIPSGATLAPGPYAKLTVTDTGPGIDDHIVERIFEPFFTTKGPDRGTGLGLAVVHGIVKRHAGDIIAASVPGGGAKFEVYLPTVAQQDAEQLPIPDPDSLTGSERILFVDDEPKFVMVTQRQLEHLGYQVTIFTSPISALEHFGDSPDDFDLVISDVAMPKMTGEKFVNQIRLIRPDIPAILCTGYSNKVDKQKAQLMGCEYVLKPVERDQLAQMVRKALDAVPAP